MAKREETKIILKEKILKAAKDVFKREGFEAATISMIAQTAGVGLGTAYNYFKSKEDIFILAMADELVAPSEGGPLTAENADNAGKAVSTLVLANIKRLKFFNKKIWRVALSSIFSSLKSDNPVIKELIKSDYRFMDKISAAIEKLKMKGLLQESFCTQTAVRLIYGSVMFNLMAYVYEDDSVFDDICKKIEDSILFIVRQ